MKREEAKQELTHELRVWESECKSAHPMKEALDMAIEALNADAVEVVRCKDCKYWHSNTEFCSIWSFNFQNIAQRTLRHDYCSRGERKEE